MPYIKKYKLTNESKNKTRWIGKDEIQFKLYRIKALIDFNDIKKGDLGGWIESELNLSQDGLCWIYDDDSTVSEKAIVSGNAKITGYSTINGVCKIYDNATINSSDIGGTSEIFGNAEIIKSSINGESTICDNAKISNSRITGDGRYSEHYTQQKLRIYGNSRLQGVMIDGAPHIYENAIIDKGVSIEHSPRIYGRSILRGQVKPDNIFLDEATLFILDDTEIFGNAVIEAKKKDKKESSLFIKNSARIYGNSHIVGSGSINGRVRIYDYAKIDGLFHIDEHCEIFGETNISGKFKIWLFGHIKVSGVTFIRADKKTISLEGKKNIKNKTITRNLFLGLF